MDAFEQIFSEEMEGLESAISGIPSEQRHIRRCMALAEAVEWDRSNDRNEIGKLLGARGCRWFDQVTRRIASTVENETDDELRDGRRFLRWLMLVHDIGKFDRATGSYNGSGHEERSGDYVSSKSFALQRELHWSQASADLLVHLTRFHSHLGITRLGEVSNVFLEPILDVLVGWNSGRKRLFLDYLIVMTCCDAGASGDFEAERFYLDESRIEHYVQVAEELLGLAEQFGLDQRSAASRALLAHASDIDSTVARIRRMITSENRMDAADRDIQAALRSVVSRGIFDPRRFALTQFDHGAYVFAPLLARISDRAEHVTMDALEKFIAFLGVLSASSDERKVIQFRCSFSMKTDLRSANRTRFEALCDAVESGDPKRIDRVAKAADG